MPSDRVAGDLGLPTFDANDLAPVENLIGNGGMGIVSLFRWRRTVGEDVRKDDLVAAKRLPTLDSDLTVLKEEAKILWGLHDQCEYILRLYGALNYGADFCLLLEYMKFGNIAHFFKTVLQAECAKGILWPLKIQIGSQICKGMEFLHGLQPRPVLHRDLKAANVLLDQKLNVKICDFGLAKIKELTTKPSSTPVTRPGAENANPAGTVSHLAPELLNGTGKATKKSDVYSFGILLWELVTDESPYRGMVAPIVIYRVSNCQKRPDETLLPKMAECQPLVDAMRRSWQQDPKKRPEFGELARDFQRFLSLPRDVEHSVQSAIKAWETKNRTHVKELNDPWDEENQFTVDRNTGDCHSAPEKMSRQSRSSYNMHTASLQTQSPARMGAGEVRNVLIRRGIGGASGSQDIPSNILCISNSTDSFDTSVMEKESNAPLLGAARMGNGSLASSVATLRSKQTNRRCTCGSVLILLALILVGAGTGGFFLSHFTWKNSIDCCLHCFNWADPSLTSDCSSLLENTQSASPGSKCTFRCGEGYVLNGNHSQLTCSANGTWSGPLPYCRKVRQCADLPPPANNGIINCTNKNFESSVCKFQCSDGYRLRPAGDEILDHVTCESDEYLNYHWTGPEPYCEKVIPCSPPPLGKNVIATCNQSPAVPEKLRVAEDPQSFSNGTTCQFSCPAGTSISSDSYGLCQKDGTWNFTSTSCTEGCPAFSVPDRGNVSCTLGRNYNSHCQFACQDNYILLGDSNMVCMKNGKWTTKPPTCACPTCRSGAYCQNTVKFEEVLEKMNETLHSGSFYYDGHTLFCYPPKRPSGANKLTAMDYTCQCRDRKTNNNKQCNKLPTQFDACKHALASLILIMASNGTYTLPCDAELMPKSC